MTTPAAGKPADKPADKPVPVKKTAKQVTVEWIKSIAVALAIWLVLRTILVEAFRIPSSSMEHTLEVGDFLFVNKAVYGARIPYVNVRMPVFREPKRLDVVVFSSKMERGVKVVKRLIGMPGDTLEMRDSVLLRNGVPQAEPYASYLNPEIAPTERSEMLGWQGPFLLPTVDVGRYAPDRRHWGPIVVPPGQLFVMGDNRDSSWDSRYWGFIPRDSIRGTPLFIYYSYDPSSWRSLPGITAIRWGRLGSRPK
jgi:signal peptidase I